MKESLILFKVVKELEDNPLGELVELKFEIDSDSNIVVDLRIGLMEISFPETVYRVGLSTAYLRLDLEGLKVRIGRRYGDVNPSEANISELSSQSMHLKANIAISGMLSAVPTLGGELNAGSSNDASLTRASGFLHPGVRALPGNVWRIEDVRKPDQAIEATLLAGVKLASIKRVENSNRMIINLMVDANYSEIVMQSKTKRRRIRQTNRDRVVQLLATRSLAGRTGQRLTKGMPIPLSCCSQLLEDYDN
jgi:hypothetical protein